MKQLGFTFAFVLLSACTGSHLKPSCGQKFSLDAAAIEKRVFASHPSVQPVKVLACTAIPTGSGWSTDPDEEACSVWVVPGMPLEPDPPYQESSLTDVPVVVRELARDLPKLSAVFSHPYGQKLFRTGNPELVILYAPYIRCFFIEEIT